MTNNQPNLILELTFQFSLDIIEFCEVLEVKRKYVIANQLLKSGVITSYSIHYTKLYEPFKTPYSNTNRIQVLK